MIQFIVRLVVVIVRWAQVWLACSKSTGHLDVKEAIRHSESFLQRGSVLNMLLFEIQPWTEQPIHLLVALSHASDQLDEPKLTRVV